MHGYCIYGLYKSQSRVLDIVYIAFAVGLERSGGTWSEITYLYDYQKKQLPFLLTALTNRDLRDKY